MATRTLTATFSSETRAKDAADRLRQLGVGVDAIQLTWSTRLERGDAEHVELLAEIDDASAELATDALGKAGALSVGSRLNVPTSQDWLGHHHGKITSTGVPPGQGDSEAGEMD